MYFVLFCYIVLEIKSIWIELNWIEEKKIMYIIMLTYMHMHTMIMMTMVIMGIFMILIMI